MPYNEYLPDHKPDFQLFMVKDQDIPLKLPYGIQPPLKRRRFPSELLAMYPTAWPLGELPLNDFVFQCLERMEMYGSFAKRVHLERKWSHDIVTLHKLR